MLTSLVNLYQIKARVGVMFSLRVKINFVQFYMKDTTRDDFFSIYISLYLSLVERGEREMGGGREKRKR